MSDGDEEGRSRTFPALKQYCLELLELLQNPNGYSKTLSHLHDFLRQSPHAALQPFFDYTLFPLLILLDAAISCRSQSHVESEEISAETSALKMPHKVSDIVAEGVLQCLEELLKKCCIGSVDQFVLLLKKLTYGALLSPSEAAEEFRGGVIRCFRALLSTLCLCPDESCICKQIEGWPTLLVNSDLQSQLASFSVDGSEPEECLIAFLQSQSVSAAVGHWLSLLLKSADVEAARGNQGSAKLRVDAFLTLRILVSKVGTADALAFFLPGVVSQFGKVLHVSKSMISGAAGSAEAMDQAIRGLAEFLMIVLEDNANLALVDDSAGDISGRYSNTEKSPIAFLEELRHLPVTKQNQSELVVKDLSEKMADNTHKSDLKGKGGITHDVLGSLHVNRSKDWLSKTSVHVDKLLSTTFPRLCVHPAKRVRQGLLAAIKGLLSKCSCTLKDSRLMLMECLCVLVCDDCEDVSAAAQEFLGYLFLSSGKSCISRDVAEIFKRLFEKLPEVVLGREETLVISHVQKLFVLIYFSGPQLVTDHLLQSPVMAARFFDTFAVCLSQNSVFTGSLDKLLLDRPSSVGYLRSITEIKTTSSIVGDSKASKKSNASGDSNFSDMQNRSLLSPLEEVKNEYTLPRMPPWFASIGSQKLYEAFGWVLRLVGLSLVADTQSKGSLSIIKDIPLSYLRKLVSEVRMKEYSKESWQSWYNRTGSGQIVRQSSTAACILNEMIFGLSDQAVDTFAKIFHKSYLSGGETEEDTAGRDSNNHFQSDIHAVWKGCLEKDARGHLIGCIGSILHEYLSPEVWNLPSEPKYSQQSVMEAGEVTLHFLQDNAMLHQVIIDGIGIFSMCIQADFSLHGFLQSSLYMLLENLICSNFHIRRASDAVLHVISATSGYPTVGHLVLANSDYVIDSICRQLRHLDLNPHVPSVLAAMLSYIGVAHKILPLLEEPMRSVSQELEILGRHEHPHLTISFLMAVAEIAKASKLESSSLPTQAESYFRHVKSKHSSIGKGTRKEPGTSKSFVGSDVYMDCMESEVGECSYDVDLNVEQCESILFKLNEAKRYRRTVGSVIGSCLIAATPLLVSSMQTACLAALDIVEDGVLALSKVEEAYRHEKETIKVIRQVFEMHSLHNLCDALDAEEDGAEENRLLPAMNKIWPFFIACFQNRSPVAVRRCSAVISSAVQICGGDFFSRRFYADGSHLWKVLSTSPYQKKKPVISKEEKSPLQLPYRSSTSSLSSGDSRAEVSDLKVQVAVLNMIADLSGNRMSASALEAVLKKVAGLVVGIACSGVVGLRDASMNALIGLSSMDPDLVWLLLADVYYSMKNKKKNDLPSVPSINLPEIFQLLPPPLSPKDYLFVQYGGQSYGFDIDFSSVESTFNKLSRGS